MLAAAGAVSRPSTLLAAAPEPYSLPLNLVHPELRPAVRMIEAFTKGRPGVSRGTLEQARKPMPNPLFNPAPLSDVPFERRMIPGGKGQPDVAVYVVNGRAGASRPAILHTHGGGFVLGTAESGVRDLQGICKELDCVAVSVDYRLAPETTYAGSIEDNYAGLKWLHAHAAELGADPARIAVMGESAGGGHAALLAITARDRGEVPLCFQCLIYPMLDDRTGSSVIKPRHVGALIWTPESNRFGWESFLGQKPGGRSAPKGAVPARVADVSGLPPAFIGVGSIDLFCDEDVDYAQRLNAAGVSTELVVVPGAFHGFDGIAMMLKAPLGAWFRAEKLNALRRGFGMAAI
ncbi:MAG: alpha/beta hydrolase [Sphingomonadales bacterium]|nr:alpha/beta hydrolase [Sphingomonadales bacterium]